VVIGDPRPESDVGPTPSRKVVVEKLPDGEEMITITIRGSTMGSHERKAEASTSARDGGKRKPIVTDSEHAVRPPAGRSDHHGRPERATPSRSQTAHRTGPTMTIDDPTTHGAGQTTPSQDKAPQMIKLWSLKAGKWKMNKGRNKKLTFKPTFDYLLNKYTKVGSKDQAMKRSRSPMRQDRREQPKQAKPEAKGKRVAVEVYDTRVSQSPHFTHPFGHPGVSSSTSFPGS
jgi:hypothetical protein